MNLEKILERIQEARLAYDPYQIVHLVAVSKYTDKAAIATLYAQGQRAFGESRVQDLAAKEAELSDLPLQWHFIGRLQTNKINALIQCQPALMHGLDSLALAQELQKRLEAKQKRMACLLQINSAREESKAGVAPEQACEIYAQIGELCPNIELRGVMSIGAHTSDTRVIQKSFQTTHALFEALRPKGATLCSMGMSSDFELAIACGGNLLRLGSILFGES